MWKDVLRKVSLFTIVMIVTMLIGTGSVVAWETNKHAYHFGMHQFNPGGANDAMVWATAWSSTRIWRPPILQKAWTNCFPKRKGWILTKIVRPWRMVKFGYAHIPYCKWCWFNVDFYVRSLPPYISTAWFRWTLDNQGIGRWVWLGWRVSSPAALYNPATDPDGNPAEDMVVRNIQFANSPTRIPNDQTTLDNLEVVALFAASQDQGRLGPFIVHPGTEVIIDPVPVVDEPVVGGRTVLAKGEIEVPEAEGGLIPFVMQFIAEKDRE